MILNSFWEKAVVVKDTKSVCWRCHLLKLCLRPRKLGILIIGGGPLPVACRLSEPTPSRLVHPGTRSGPWVEILAISHCELNVPLARTLRDENVPEFIPVTRVICFHNISLNFLLSHCATSTVLHNFYLFVTSLHLFPNLCIAVWDTWNLDTILPQSL
jgi:hypothetical protein